MCGVGLDWAVIERLIADCRLRAPPVFAASELAMQRNHVIAVIIIILFVLLALVSFGIYRLVHNARGEMSVESGTSTGSSASTGRRIVDD
ncbi:hypothetical protein CDD82_4648 [Ophiocordyceps australis]|uniref:Uncharacterized protein n=1 Tax=Ophiocordyceps australis TaxID=1399860 RepID=A0A2C5Z539_9HYPO|nr:hypothetical protein CDD82_4648 [Ophiocordyceps australis]